MRRDGTSLTEALVAGLKRGRRGPLLLTAVALLAATALAACGGDDGGSGAAADSSTPDGAATTGSEEEIDDELAVSEAGWKTDFSKHSVSLSEFLGGGPPKDGIPSIDDPKFIPVGEADEFLGNKEAVAVITVDGVTRGYPIQILTWHEIVNDEIKGMPVAVTFCPLCNSTVAFSREVDGETLEFGTTGNLRRSDLVMYDRKTESWWQQLTAEAIVGELTGTKLEVLPSQILSWGEFKKIHPDAEVLSRDTGFMRSYGENPYVGYDADPGEQPFALDQPADRALPPKERVTAIQTGGGEAVVYPFPRLADDAPINERIGNQPAVVFYSPDAASALDDQTVGGGRSVGASAVFERKVAGRTLTFEPGPEPGTFTDAETGSEWNMAGEGVSGPLAGEQLTQIPSDDQFWFALAAFFEEPDIRG